MESTFGMQNMAKEAVVFRMIRDHEKELQEIARVSHMVRQSGSGLHCGEDELNENVVLENKCRTNVAHTTS